MSAPMIETLLRAGENVWVALAVKATLAMVAALIVLRLAHRAAASARHLVAAAVFGVLLLLPLVATLAPARVIAVARPAAAPAATRAPAEGLQSPAAAAPSSPAAPAGWTLPRVSPADVVAAAYLTGVAVLLLSLAAGVRRLRGLYRRAEVSVSGTRLANEAARREGMEGGIEVAVSPELAVPVTFGWSHPVILLPMEASQWDEPEVARAIRHELEHVARGDWGTHTASRVALALYWMHPLAWVLWHRLRLEAERACDDAVVRSLGQAETYAEQLVSLARRLRDSGSVPALAMSTRSTLGVRVDSILDERRRRTPRSRWASLAVAAASLACVLAIAPFQVVGAALPAIDDAGALHDEEDEADPRAAALMAAAQRGDLRRMKRLLDAGADADAVVPGDGSPLIAAARGGSVEAIEMLIAAGANVNRGVSGDGNALTAAARGGHLEAVRALLDRGADVDAGVPGDGNALIMAAGDGQMEVVRLLLDRGAGLETVVEGDENPLIHASEGGQAEVVRLLIDRGANVNARVWAARHEGGGGEWRTPLAMARRRGHAAVVRILQAAGARE
jgi:bla regulator protein blaR1